MLHKFIPRRQEKCYPNSKGSSFNESMIRIEENGAGRLPDGVGDGIDGGNPLGRITKTLAEVISSDMALKSSKERNNKHNSGIDTSETSAAPRHVHASEIQPRNVPHDGILRGPHACERERHGVRQVDGENP